MKLYAYKLWMESISPGWMVIWSEAPPDKINLPGAVYLGCVELDTEGAQPCRN